jgi:hypothetical protein
VTPLLPLIVPYLLLCVVAGVLTYRFVRPGQKKLAAVIAVLAVGWIAVDILHFRRTYAFARWTGWRDVMTLANLEPLATAVLIAVLFRVSSGKWYVKTVLATAMAGVMLWQSYGQFFGPTPDTLERWNGEVCRQTTRASCSAASAATLLTLHGIPATETEMAKLCLTTDSGTQLLGLYRGLRIKTEGTPWKVVPFRGDIQTLRNANRPAILTVGIDYWQTTDPRYAADWGWIPGMFHTVVFMKFVDGGKVEIGDPGVGKEQWEEQGILDLWKGEGYWLVPR